MTGVVFEDARERREVIELEGVRMAVTAREERTVLTGAISEAIPQTAVLRLLPKGVVLSRRNDALKGPGHCIILWVSTRSHPTRHRSDPRG